MAGMLYYPFANAPLPVLQQAVMYWDDLATVVAPGWEDRMTDHMRRVQDGELYRPVEPAARMDIIELGSIERELANALDNIPLDDLAPPGPNEMLEEREHTLHAEKLHQTITDELVRRGLVRETSGAPWRLIASPKILNIVVSVVANVIARTENNAAGCSGSSGLRPHTDVPSAHRLGTDPIAGEPASWCWNVDLSSLLSVPQEDVSLADLISFRTSYDDERRRMMDAIDDLLHELSLLDRHPADAIRRVEREIADAIDDHRKAAKSKRIALAVRPAATVVAVTATSMASGAPPALAASLGVLSGLGVNIATASIRHEPGTHRSPADYRYLHRFRTEMMRSGFSYS